MLSGLTGSSLPPEVSRTFKLTNVAVRSTHPRRPTMVTLTNSAQQIGEAIVTYQTSRRTRHHRRRHWRCCASSPRPGEVTSIRDGTSSSCSTQTAESFACKASRKCWPTTSTSTRKPWPGRTSATPRQPSNSISPPSKPLPLSRAGYVSPGWSTTWRQDKSKPSSRHRGSDNNKPPNAEGAPGSTSGDQTPGRARCYRD